MALTKLNNRALRNNSVTSTKLASSNAMNIGVSKWTIELDTGDNDLLFKYNGTTVFKLASDGAVTSANDVTAFGSP